MPNIINQFCPHSGKRISVDALTSYRGFTVGFCSKQHKDNFEQGNGDFSKAIRYFEILIKEYNLMPINNYCPHSGKPVSPQITAQYKGMKVGFCNTTHRNKFIENTENSSKTTEYFDILIKENYLSDLEPTPTPNIDKEDEINDNNKSEELREKTDNIDFPDVPTFA